MQPHILCVQQSNCTKTWTPTDKMYIERNVLILMLQKQHCCWCLIPAVLEAGMHMAKENHNFCLLCLPQSLASLLLLSGRQPWVTIILTVTFPSGLRQCTAHLTFAAKKVLPGHGDLPLSPRPGFASAAEGSKLQLVPAGPYIWTK